MQETRIQSLGPEDPLREENCSPLQYFAWEIPWAEEPGGLQSMGSQKVRHDWMTSLSLSRLVIAFLPRSKHLLISWLQSPSAVILEPPKIKSATVSTVSPSVSHEVIIFKCLVVLRPVPKPLHVGKCPFSLHFPSKTWASTTQDPECLLSWTVSVLLIVELLLFWVMVFTFLLLILLAFALVSVLKLRRLSCTL